MTAARLPRPPRGFVPLALIGLALFWLQVIALPPVVWEDAFISLRFARNLAAGDGLTFNPGDAGVEGVSNLGWVLCLAFFSFLWPALPSLAFGLGVAAGSLTLALVAWAACRAGPHAWVAVLAVALNPAFAELSASGMETALASLVVTCIALSWMSEEGAPEGRLRATSVLCALLALVRAEGWFMFLGISAVRLLPGHRTGWRAFLRSWCLPFGALFAVLSLLRLASFGTVVPHIYFTRVAVRGELLDRLAPGAGYVLFALLINPALALGLTGARRLAKSPGAARLAALVAIQLALCVLVGGDASYMGFSRFLLPVIAPLALLAQRGVDLFASGARHRGPVLALAAIVVAGGSAVFVRPRPEEPRVEAAPLWRLVAADPRGPRDALVEGWRHVAEGRVDASRITLDGTLTRYLIGSIRPPYDVSCGQAGQIAFLWPGRVLDHNGLATVRPRPFDSLGPPPPRWCLPVTGIYAAHWEQLRDAGYRFDRFVLYGTFPNPPYFTGYPLLRLTEPETALELQAGWVDDRKEQFLWWRIPRERLVILGDSRRDEPVFDGLADRLDEGRIGELHPEVQRWLRSGEPPDRAREGS